MALLGENTYEDAYRELCGALESVRAAAGVRSALLCDSAGRLVLQAGEVPGADPDGLAAACCESLRAERPLAGLPSDARGAALHVSGPLGSACVLRIGRGMHLALALGPESSPGCVWRRVVGAAAPLERILARFLDGLAAAGGEDPRDVLRRELNLRIDDLFTGGGR